MKKSSLIAFTVTFGIQVAFAQSQGGAKDMMKVNPEAVEQEALVSISEAKAIEALIRIIDKRKGSSEEAGLWERLSELYLKQAKSARFFSLTKTSEKTLSFLPPIIGQKSLQKPLNEAVKAFETIKRRFPKYENMDRVLFHSSLTYAQMGRFALATNETKDLLARFPKSEWIPDAHLLIGEVFYDQQNFSKALEHFTLAAQSRKEKVGHYAQYKKAWAEYNLNRHNAAISSLQGLVKELDPQKAPNGFALRGESLRDMALFLTESQSPSEAYTFFNSFTSEQETADALIRMANIYKSHSKHKDMETLGDLYLKKSTFDAGKIQFHLLYADLFRELKKGDKQIDAIKKATELCQIQPSTVEACETPLRSQITQAAEMWWKEWSKSKSKQSLDFARKALEIEIERNPNPRPQTLEAYAELLFQSEDYEAASRVYLDLAKVTKDPIKEETFLYGRLVSLDRLMVKDPKKILPREDFKTDCAQFVKKFQKSIHKDELTLKLARLHFEDLNPTESEKLLKDLLSRKQKVDVLIPAQNQLIEALNKNEKQKELKPLLATWIEQAPTPARKTELRRLQAKLSLEDLESDSTGKAGKAILQSHLAFFKKYEDDTQVSEPVLWKTLGLALTENEIPTALDLIEKAGVRAPKDVRVWDSLKQILIKMTAQRNQKMTPEQSKLLGRTFNISLKYVPQKDRSGVLWSYREFLLEKNGEGIKKVEDEIISLGVEPESSMVKVARLESRLQSGQYKSVFEESKKFVSSKAPAPVRARARLIQAQVLEEEFKTQSVKTSLDRMQTVVAMKLEKMSKAQEAFVNATQLSNEPKISEDARLGLKRVFEHAILALKNIQIKDKLTAEEKKALDQQIQILVVPLEAQLKELNPVSGLTSDAEKKL